MIICKPELCTGCAACYSACQRSCITMREDENGFIRPIIDEYRCSECSLCVHVCPSNNSKGKKFNSEKELRAYAFTNSQRKVLRLSSSGGAFSVLAEDTICQGGVVFGVKFDDDFIVKTCFTDYMIGLDKMRGSKYVESLVGDSLIEAKKLLDDGKKVLYSGTPCQVAGLYSLLGNNQYPNLLTAELLCHGVPNNRLFQSYLRSIEQRYGKIERYSFRDKTKWGWGNWGSFTYLHGHMRKVKYFPVACDAFYSLYFNGNIFRESCYTCPYASLPRKADITIGDFWGIDEILPSLDSRLGVSLVLTNNDHGNKAFINAVEKAGQTFIEINEIDAIISRNQTIIRPSDRPISRNSFFNDFNRLGFEYAASKHCETRRVLPVLSRYVPKWLKKVLKALRRR